MRRVFSRGLIAVLAVIVITAAPVAFADPGSADPGLWAQFVSWTQDHIGIPPGATTADGMTFEDWLVLMERINIPPG